jgi:disintegrin and metalloproteinase domain-containing protein 10
MDHIQNSVEDEPTPPPQPPQEHKKPQAFVPPALKPHPPHNKYSREANEGSSDHHRNKRATKPREENKNTCSLFIQTDPLIWRHISEQVRREYDFDICLEYSEHILYIIKKF